MEWDLELRTPEAAAIALAILFGSLLLLIGFWKRLPKRSSAPPLNEAAEMQAAMARLSGELPELLRNMNGRLDAKMQALRKLIREADTTIEELYRLRVRPAAGCDPAPPVASSLLADELDARATPDIDLDAAELAEPAAAERKPVELSARDTTELRSQRYAHVYSLADRGLDSAGISGETGMHRGEVELVLNLRRKRVRVDRGSRSEPSPVIRSPEEAPA